MLFSWDLNEEIVISQKVFKSHYLTVERTSQANFH